MQSPELFNPLFPLISELIFTLVAVFFCLIIYFKTRESYKLTKYEGLKYFRDAFLFFGFAYLLRLIFSLMIFFNIAFNFTIPRHGPSPLFLLPLGYFSTVAIFYLLYSSIWKRFKSKWILILGHSFAIIIPIISFVTRTPKTLLILQTILLVAAATLSLFSYKNSNKDKKKTSNIQLLYFLVCSLWLFNLWLIDSRTHFPQEIKILCQILALLIFFLVYRRISKWVK